MHLTQGRGALWVSSLMLLALCARPGYSLKNQNDEKSPAEAHPGSLVIEPQFAAARPFSEGVAAVQIGDRENGKWGYIDKAGRLVIDPHFDAAEAFSEGLAAVRLGDAKTGKWGFVDKSGKFIISPRWDHVEPFARGIAVVRSGDIVTGKERLIDKQGNYVSDIEAGVVLPCGNGLTLVGVNVSWDDLGVNRRFGFVDKTGKYIFERTFDDAYCFTEGIAAVRIGADSGKWGFIDTSGQFVLEPQWDAAMAFQDGMATVATSGVGGKKWGLIDRSGQIVIAPQYAEPLVFNEGLAIVSHTVYKWGQDDAGATMAVSETSYSFINRNGAQTIGAHWQSVSIFSQALAPVMLDGYPRE